MSPSLLTVVIGGRLLWFKVQLLLLSLCFAHYVLSGSLVNLEFIRYKSCLSTGICRMVVLNDP